MDNVSDDYSGFIVSGFEQGQIYGFKEGSEGPEIHFLKQVPFIMTQQEYSDVAAVFLASFQRKWVEKAVFSRVKALDFNSDHCDSFFARLCEAYPSAFVYFISSDLFGTWIGATPEKLLAVRSGQGSTVSLAGTKPAEDDSPWGVKEQKEQQFVTDFIVDRLGSAGIRDIHVSERYEAIAGPVKHLKNDISFNLEGKSSSQIAMELHPTPAVSGYPQKEAIDLILDLEPHRRELYSGFIGLIGEDSTDLFVNLRCCSIGERAAYLYLGGGFTYQSSIEKEWEETENKSKTLLNILQKL
jgi:isochorismate synthase